MASERAAVNARISQRDKDDMEQFVGPGRAYPTVSQFIERAIQHLLDHEHGRIVEGTDAVRDEIVRGAADDLIEDRLKVILARWSRNAGENSVS